MAMNPTLKWGLIIGGGILFIVLITGGLLYAGNKAEDDAYNAAGEIEDELSADPLTNSECRKLCRDICKKYPLLFGGRGKCKKACKLDCKSGEDVTQNTY